jgi:pimeloyl-ACP methyl ester carboxylesterase
MIGDWSAWQPAHREPECLLRERLIPLLRRAKPIPALVVQSELDFEGAHRSSQKLLDALPYAASIRLKDAGHFPNMETPETFNRELQAFLELKERKA